MYDFGHAIVADEKEKIFEDMEIDDKVSRTVITEYLDVSSFYTPATYTVTTKCYGENADMLRTSFEYYSAKEIAESYLESYGILYPNIREKEKMKITDDIEKNVFTLVETYEISDIWSEESSGRQKVLQLQYEPMSIYTFIIPMTCEEKKNRVSVPYPANIQQRTEILLPEFLTAKGETEYYENEAFDFTYKLKRLRPDLIALSYDFSTKVNEIEGRHYSKMCSQINEASNNLPIVLTFPKPREKRKRR